MKKVLIAILVLAMLMAFAGCAAKPAQTEAPAPAEESVEAVEAAKDDTSDQLYVFVTALTGLEYMNDHELGFNLACEELGVRHEYFGPTDSNEDDQIAAFEQAIAMQPKGIITLPVSEALTDVINKAEAAGIPVITVDNDCPDSNRSCFIGTGNVAAGAEGGEYLLKHLDGPAKIAVLTAPGVKIMEDRLAGYESVLKNNPDIEIVQIGDTKRDYLTAVSTASSILQAYPDLDVFICLDASGASGAMTAVKEAGLEGKVMIMGMDKDSETLVGISEGVITGSLAQRTALMPYYAMQVLYGYVNLSTELGYGLSDDILAFPNTVDTGCYVVDSNNVDLFLK